MSYQEYIDAGIVERIVMVCNYPGNGGWGLYLIDDRAEESGSCLVNREAEGGGKKKLRGGQNKVFQGAY